MLHYGIQAAPAVFEARRNTIC